ncbi:MAG: amino acid permease [Pyrinomonadaceae bacterium]
MAETQNIHIETELSRDLGLISALATGVGTMIAAGIFSLSGLAIKNVGSAAIASFLIAAFVALFTALTYCEFVSIYPNSGEGYLYARRTFSAPLAFLVGWALFLGYASSCGFYLATFSSYFIEFVYHLPFEIIAGTVALILVNAALIFHRRKYPNIERPFRVPLVPLLPILGILSNLYLLAQSTSELWTLGGFFGNAESSGILPVVLAAATLAAGFVAFVIFGESKDSETTAEESAETSAIHSSHIPQKAVYRVLVMLSNPANLPQLLSLANAVTAEKNGDVVGLRVAIVPRQLSPNREVFQQRFLRHARASAIGDGKSLHRFKKILFGSVPEVIAKESLKTVVLVKRKN